MVAGGAGEDRSSPAPRSVSPISRSASAHGNKLGGVHTDPTKKLAVFVNRLVPVPNPTSACTYTFRSR